MTAWDGVVVGSGPNGLAAAVELARHGLRVRVLEAADRPGGGTRSAELTLPGFLHDVCSAVHPLAVGSPGWREWPLEDFGLEWIHPEIPLAHPLDGGRAAVLHRTPDAPPAPDREATSTSLERTAAALGADGDAWRHLFGPLAHRWPGLAREVLRPLLHFPRHLVPLALFGSQGLVPARLLAESRFGGEPARALFVGIAAHSILPLERLGTSAVALLLGAAGHAVGWPFPRGGSRAIAEALVAYLRSLGGEVETGRKVTDLASLRAAFPSARVVLCDLSPRPFLGVAGDLLPPGSYRRRLERFRYAPGSFKLDLALDGPIPWEAPECRRAGTVHVGGTLEEVCEAEAAMAAGRPAERPFVLVAQPGVFDASRAPAGKQSVWAYCHVPAGDDGDRTEAVERQIERFAPGFRDRILARHRFTARELESYNPNYVGGDIGGGAQDLVQLLARPVASPTPYRTPVEGVYLCSSSTPPGGGVHGMCGILAARAALQDLP